MRDINYKEFVDEIKDKNYFLFLGDVTEQLRRYRGKYTHSVNGLIGVIQGDLCLRKSQETFEEIKKLTICEILGRDNIEFMLESMYEHWKMGAYNI